MELRRAPLLIAATFCVSCTGLEAPPNPLARVERQWNSTSGGYVYAVGYFTESELADRRWEKARLESRKFAAFCHDEERVRHRDVRWIRPATDGGAACARVYYTIACRTGVTDLKPGLDYLREDMLLEEIDKEVPADCGDKFAAVQRKPKSASSSRLEQRKESFRKLESEDAVCASQPATQGRIRILPGTRIMNRIVIAPGLLDLLPVDWQPEDSRRLIKAGAFEAATVHAVLTERELADDGLNIFLTETYAFDDDGSLYCVTLEARQGESVWRRSIRRDGLLVRANNMQDIYGISIDPESYWQPDSDMRSLAIDLARSMGFKHERYDLREGALKRGMRPPSANTEPNQARSRQVTIGRPKPPS